MGERLKSSKIKPAHFLMATVLVGFLGLLSWGFDVGNLFSVIVSGAGIAVVIVAAGMALLSPDDARSQATERTLRVASGTLEHLRHGLTPEGCHAVCQLILTETEARAIAMTDTERTLAYVGEADYGYGTGAPNSTSTAEVLESGHMQTFSSFDRDEWHETESLSAKEGEARVYPVGIIVPLVVADRTVGTIKLYYRHGHDADHTQLTIAQGFADLLSTQLLTYELDRQAELTARAEVKALQAQINPHFLFNTLNTIAAFTRTDPTRARDLLREFATFYRRTLEGTESLITLESEMEQTRRYLTIERARFGDERIGWTEDIEEGCEQIQIPSFIVQPVVENAVRHAMREEGTLNIDVQVATDGSDVLIAIADDGVGMDEKVAQQLAASFSSEGSILQESPSDNHSQGTGIALRNVADRIEHCFGVGSGIEIMSKVGSGTCVTLRLVGVAPRHAH